MAEGIDHNRLNRVIESNEPSSQPLFKNLDAGNVEELEISEIESLCIGCEEMGSTRMLLTKIPMFRDVIVMSFNCPHCGYANNEVQQSSEISDQGIRYTITVHEQNDLNRLLVKADSASISIPSLEFEIPSGTQKGAINTVEGFMQSSIDGLLLDQTTRKVFNPDIAEKIDKFIEKLNNCLKIQIPFKMVVDDPSGNSFVENKLYPDTDPNLIIEKYTRSKDQEQQLGMFLNNDEDMAPNEAAPCDNSTGVSHDEVLTFSDSCPNCRMVTTTNMKLVDIPHFKEVVIMATSCDHCGYKHNEVKSGSGISEKGKRIELHLIDPSDLSRDILKSETATLSIPELQLDMTEGTLGGRFTTIEGLLSAIKKQLSDDNPFVVGDSSSHSLMSKFISDLTEVIKGKRLDIHIILDDPAGNSYLQNVYAPDDDPEMKIIQYERSFEQNENLGLNDMKTKDY